MAKNTKDKFIGMTKMELEKKLTSFRDELRGIHFKSEGAKSKNVKLSTTLRKQVARILTILNSTRVEASK